MTQTITRTLNKKKPFHENNSQKNFNGLEVMGVSV